MERTTGMLKVQAVDQGMTADEMINSISQKMTMQHRTEAPRHTRFDPSIVL